MKIPFERPRRRWENANRLDFEKQDKRVKDRIQWPALDHGNELSVSTNSGKFLDKLNDYRSFSRMALFNTVS